MPKRERYAIRFSKGGIVPADEMTRAKLNERYRVGDVAFIEIVKPRNPGYHRLAHGIADLIRENIEAFAHLHQHDVLKRLQIEANVGCEQMGIFVPGVGLCQHLIPRSLSYESMDQTEFEQVISGLCDYVAKTYWPGMEPEQIEQMAEAMAA